MDKSPPTSLSDQPIVAEKHVVGVLAVSHIDLLQAEQWLGWRKQLKARTKESAGTLVVAMTQRITMPQKGLLAIAAGEDPDIIWYTLEEENEQGYPRSACHLFISALTYCERYFPGRAVLWLEADTVPMREGWFQAIVDEYRKCGKPFMGCIERNVGDAHMAGCGVYPPNWRELAPKLAESVSAPDVPQFGPGHGQSFDVYAKDEIVPQCAHSEMIQQIWHPQQPIRETWAKQYIRPQTALFHQCKDGSLIAVLRGFPNGYAPPGATSPAQILPPRGISITSKKVGGFGS